MSERPCDQLPLYAHQWLSERIGFTRHGSPGIVPACFVGFGPAIENPHDRIAFDEDESPLLVLSQEALDFTPVCFPFRTEHDIGGCSGNSV
jgi:hypothetical protein